MNYGVMTFDPLLDRSTTKVIIECFYEVYNNLGFGFHEHIYSLAMERELVARGLTVHREVEVPVWYKGEVLATQRLDMIVADRVLVETRVTARRASLREKGLGCATPRKRPARIRRIRLYSRWSVLQTAVILTA